MKKIIIGLFLLLNILIMEKVNAQTYKLSINKQSGIYFARTGGNSPYMSSQFAVYKMDDEIAYCIETGKHITTYNYVDKGNIISLNYSEAIKEKLGLIGYYGREYPNHNTVRYSMAAQALIWEITSNQKVTFWTKQYEEGNKIDISKEKNEINNLINKHNSLPNIEKNITIKFNEKKELQDELLKDFEIVDSNYDYISLNENKLIIEGQKVGTYHFTLRKKRYDDKETLIFVGSGGASTQTMARLRAPNMPSMEININIEGPKIKINKIDDNGNVITLPIKFKIKDLNNNIYMCRNDSCTYEINSNGYILTESLPYGTYEIEEVVDGIIKGYSVNKDKIQVTLDQNSENEVEVYFTNYIVKGVLRLHKTYEKFNIIQEEFNYDYYDLEGIEFDIYDDNNYIDTITTDSLGYAEYRELRVGNYHLVEKNIKEGFWLAEADTYFKIEQDNPYDSIIYCDLEIRNYLDKGILEFTKKDSISNVGIANTIIEIYSLSNELLLTCKTDYNGKVIINNMPIGQYYIIEKEANKMYQKTNEKVYFEIINNGKTECEMINEKKIIKVPKTDSNEKKYFNIIMGFSILLSLGGIIYEREKII